MKLRIEEIPITSHKGTKESKEISTVKILKNFDKEDRGIVTHHKSNFINTPCKPDEVTAIRLYNDGAHCNNQYNYQMALSYFVLAANAAHEFLNDKPSLQIQILNELTRFLEDRSSQEIFALMQLLDLDTQKEFFSHCLKYRSCFDESPKGAFGYSSLSYKLLGEPVDSDIPVVIREILDETAALPNAPEAVAQQQKVVTKKLQTRVNAKPKPSLFAPAPTTALPPRSRS